MSRPQILTALEVVSIMGVGYDGVDVPAALERGIPVTHTPGVLNDGVADLAISLMFCVARRIPQADRYVREGRWASEGLCRSPARCRARAWASSAWAASARAIAGRAQAFGMSVAYTARSARPQIDFDFHPTADNLRAHFAGRPVLSPVPEWS